MDYYAEAFTQCNEHLRETDKKRDQIVAFYGILIAAFLNSFDKIGGLKPLVTLVLALTGLGIAMAVMNYRKWHLLYVQTASTLQYLSASQTPLSQQNINQAWNKFTLHRQKYGGPSLNPFMSTEVAIFNVFLIVWFLPCYVAIPSQWLTLLSCSYFEVGFFILFLTIGNVCAANSVSRARKAEAKDIWLLNFVVGIDESP